MNVVLEIINLWAKMGLVHQDDIIDIINLMNNNSSVYIITYYHKVYGRYSNEYQEHTQEYIQE